ncbi:MAG: NigD-like protein [Parabacteroides sp.]
MKMLKRVSWMWGLCLLLTLMSSCLDDDDYSLGNFSIDVASVKAPHAGAPYFRLDDGTTLWPAAGYMPVSLKDNQRVLMNYTLLGDSAMGAVGYDYYIRVNRLDTLLTKKPVDFLGAETDSVYGTDPVKIISMWTGNGHLTIQFEADFGGRTPHWLNLVHGSSAEDPYLLEFHQNAYDDPRLSRSSGLVCFDLSPLAFPSDPVTLTIRVNTFDGMQDYQVTYDAKGEESGGEMADMKMENLGHVE